MTAAQADLALYGASYRCVSMDGEADPHERLQIGLGQYLRGAHELCLLGVRGDAMVPAPADRLPSVVFAPRGLHSAKPPVAYAVIERVSPGPRAEMFARTPRPGWAVWGNESGADELWAEAAGTVAP